MNYAFKLTISKNKQIRILNINDGYSFIIFEFLPTNQMFIMSVKFLVENKYIATDIESGKYEITIPFSTLKETYWMNFLNNFDQFENIVLLKFNLSNVTIVYLIVDPVSVMYVLVVRFMFVLIVFHRYSDETYKSVKIYCTQCKKSVRYIYDSINDS
jgi:hypothetical protein